MENPVYDIAIIGGGINGCGIARDAAGRGLSVYLAEKSDLASGTSSASTKLIHGGLRYLEHYEFRLVREALSEREVLWQIAPHIIRPLRFVLPHHKDLRPAWLIRLGLFLYDHLGGRKLLPASCGVDLKTDPVGSPLNSRFSHGFEYSDCWVEDARLVVLNAMDARDNGARIETETEVTAVHRTEQHWKVETRNCRSGKRETVRARTLVNAAGPWVLDVIKNRLSTENGSGIRLVKGSHIVVPRVFDHDRAYIFQNADGRIVFAIPYENDFTLIGTTDVDFTGDLDRVSADEDEVRYLCDAASDYFQDTVSPTDVVWSFSGVRPLYDDGASAAQKATRDYVLKVEGEPSGPALLNIFGGKITTYRRLAEDALARLSPWLGTTDKSWTGNASLPGGDFPVDGHEKVYQHLKENSPSVPDGVARRWVRTYGTRADLIAPDVHSEDALGIHFGAGLYACEVEYLIRHEWAVTADDILWRRTKLGLHLKDQERDRLAQWFSDNHSDNHSDRVISAA